MASARIKEYIGELVPGFDEHYRRAEQRAAADRSDDNVARPDDRLAGSNGATRPPGVRV